MLRPPAGLPPSPSSAKRRSSHGPPPSGARTGPPWELPGAFFQRWLDTAKTILLDPQGGFRNVRRTGGLGAPITYYAIGAAPFQTMQPRGRQGQRRRGTFRRGAGGPKR